MQHHHTCTYTRFQKHDGKSRQTRRCDDRRGGLCFSLLLIGAGVMFLLSHLDLLGGYTVGQFWPLLIGIPALSGLFRARSWPGRVWALVALLFADAALVNSLGLMAIPWSIIWPATIVAAGAILMAHVALSPRRDNPPLDIPADVLENPELLRAKVVCGGNGEDFGNAEFRGGVVDVFMGGYDLDLRAASMGGDSAELFVKIKLGGVKIRVPMAWRVKVEGETFMGEIEDNTASTDMAVEKELIIRASVRQGSLEIEN
ncbi:MAG: hypothetical protein JXX14_16060 [Deltaproteobacteria bacterium]|nr:hypothetical protein [Deltaproteobacteria bacterium]